MLSLAIRNFGARKLRALSTAAAVFFGVAMVAGTLMLTDSVNRSFDDIFTEVNEGIDVTVRPEGGGRGRVRLSLVRPRAARRAGRRGEADRRGRAGRRARSATTRSRSSTRTATGSARRQAGRRTSRSASSPRTLAFQPFTIVDGDRPGGRRRGRDRRITAEDEGYEVGDTIRITGAAGETDYTVAGIGEFGSGATLGGASLAEFTLAEAQRLTGKEGRVDEIDVVAADGTAGTTLAAAIAAALPPDEVEVRTGEQTASEDAGDIQEGFGFLSTALLSSPGSPCSSAPS